MSRAELPTEGEDPITELCKMLDEAGMTVRFGLRQQGHIQLIAQMILDGDDWPAIGDAIGWCPETARKHWGWLCEVSP